MIKASHNKFITTFFNWYISRLISKEFASVEIVGEWIPTNTASLIIGNHVSWWDGFWALYLSNRFLKKQFHVMMLENQLKGHKIFSKAGAFSIQPGSKSVIESLHYATQLLENESNSLVIYPQGIINSMHTDTIQFEKGVERILKNSNSFQLLFYAVFVEYFSNKKPSLYFYMKEQELESFTVTELNEKYQDFFIQSKKQQAKLKS